MTETSILTASGIYFDVLEPTVDMVCIEDIAHAAAQVNRFSGHCRYPYPVAQHSRLASYLVDLPFERWTLLHDASESYIGDMSRPLKHFTKAGEEYRKVEAKIQAVICKKFGLPIAEPREVKIADTMMLFYEKDQLMPPTREWKDRKNELAARMSLEDFELAVQSAKSDPHAIKIVETSFRDNKRMFLERFYELFN